MSINFKPILVFVNDVGDSRSFSLDVFDRKFLLLLHGSICRHKNSLAGRLVDILADMFLAWHILPDTLSYLFYVIKIVIVQNITVNTLATGATSFCWAWSSAILIQPVPIARLTFI